MPKASNSLHHYPAPCLAPSAAKLTLTRVLALWAVLATPLAGAQSVAPLPSMPPSGLPPGLSAAPVPSDGAVAYAPQLKFRNPSKPLTLGEISDLQAQKANAELMKRFGYTDVEPIRPKPPAAALEKPVLAIKTLSVWGKPEGLSAEILVNGQFKRVAGREALAPGVTVARVQSRGVELEVVRPVASKLQNKPRKGSAAQPQTETTQQRVPVGASVEIAL